MHSEHNLEYSNLLRDACSPVSVPLGYLPLSRIRAAEQKLCRWLCGEVSIPVIVSSSYIHSAISLWAELQPLFCVGHSLGRIGLGSSGCVSYSAISGQSCQQRSRNGRYPAYAVPREDLLYACLTAACIACLGSLFSFPDPTTENFLVHSLNLPCCSLSLLTCLYDGCLQFLSSLQIPFLYLKTVYPVFSPLRFYCLG